MGIKDYIYIVYKRMYINRCLIWNLKKNLCFNWKQILNLIAKLDVQSNIQLKFIIGRRRWFINLLVTEFGFEKSKILRLVLKYIKWQISLWTYRGKQHWKKLPIYGQRTRSNAKTVRRYR